MKQRVPTKITLWLIALCALAGVILFWHRTLHYELRPLSVPGTDAKLWVELKSSHPFLAEYDRKLIASRDGVEVQHELFPDTGGYGKLNFYQISKNEVLVRGSFEDMLVHVDTLKIERQEPRPKVTGQYLAAFVKARSGEWRFVSPSEEPEIPFSVQ